MLLYDLENIVRVPKLICETGEVKIWGKDSSPSHPAMLSNWDYCVEPWDPTEKQTFGSSFYLKEEEIIERVIQDSELGDPYAC
tara:strand:+ start:440 stop:688 length:249 start_codon:yes stop_codon:yes gene_type:complete